MVAWVQEASWASDEDRSLWAWAWTRRFLVETPDGHGRLELTKFSHRGSDLHAPANTPGIRHVAFAVDDIDALVASLRARGAELVGEVERYEASYPLCYVRSPEGIIPSWGSRSAEGSSRPPTASPASVVVPGPDGQPDGNLGV